MSDPESTNPPAGEPVEQPAVTGRPNDVPEPNTTFLDRANVTLKDSKAVASDSTENKSVAPRKAARKNK